MSNRDLTILKHAESADRVLTHTRSGSRLYIRLFGHIAVEDAEGRSYLPRTRKTRAMLGILAMASPKPVLRMTLADLLWSRREPEQARASLRQSVHQLQDTLGPNWAHVFVADRHHLSLRGDGLEIDARALLQPAQASADLLPGYNAILMEDLNGLDPAFDQWLDQERKRFVRIGCSVGESVLAQCVRPADTIAAAEQLLLIDRYHEAAWRAIIRAHADRGDLEAAVSTYERCCRTLAEYLDSKPSPETEDLIARIRGHRSIGHDPSHSMPALAPQGLPSSRREGPTVRLRVMPMRMIGEERDDGLGVALAEEVSAGLSRFRWISCLPPAIWSPGWGGTAEAQGGLDPASRADLVLEGTIHRGLGRIRVIIRLVDLRSGGALVWAGRFDRDHTDTLTLQDELGAAIVAQVDPELIRHEAQRSAAARQGDLSAQDLLLQALPAIYRLERTSFLNARALLRMSLQQDSGSSVAHAWLAYWNLLYVGQGWAENQADAVAEANQLAERAVMLDSGDARALTLSGHVRGFLSRHPEQAVALHDRALALNPNLALAWCFSGLAQAYLGRHDESKRHVQMALQLSPSDPHGYFFDTALTMPMMLTGDYAGAVEVGRRAVELNPLFSSAYKGYLAALGLSDRPREAAEVVRRLLELEPGFTVREAVRRSPLARPEDVARYAEGLRRAGLPDDHPNGRPTASLAEEEPSSDLGRPL